MQHLLYGTESKENTKPRKCNKQQQASQLLCEAKFLQVTNWQNLDEKNYKHAFQLH